jgi:hypothetical protein
MGRAAERGRLHDGGYVVKMTLEEAMHISDHLLPGEPGGDELARWQAMRPQPEPARAPQRLDTAPAAPVDWSTVIRQAALGERAHMVEAVGQAIGETRNEILDEIEQTITQAIDQTRNEMRAEFAKQIDQLRAELAAGLTVQGARLRSELEAVIAAKKARGRKASLLRLPKPNGDAHPQ